VISTTPEIGFRSGAPDGKDGKIHWPMHWRNPSISCCHMQEPSAQVFCIFAKCSRQQQHRLYQHPNCWNNHLSWWKIAGGETLWKPLLPLPMSTYLNFGFLSQNSRREVRISRSKNLLLWQFECRKPLGCFNTKFFVEKIFYSTTIVRLATGSIFFSTTVVQLGLLQSGSWR
jgi:hypothetical protein